MDSSLMGGCPKHCRYQAVMAYERLEPEAPPHAGVSVKKKKFPNIIKSEDHTYLSHLCSVMFPSHSCHGADPSISLGPQAPGVLKSWLAILARLHGQPCKNTRLFS